MNLSLSLIGMPAALSSDSSEVTLIVAGNTVAGGSDRVANLVAGGSGVDSCRRGRVPSLYIRVRIDAINVQRTFKRGRRSYHFSFLEVSFHLVVQPGACKQVGVSLIVHLVRVV